MTAPGAKGVFATSPQTRMDLSELLVPAEPTSQNSGRPWGAGTPGLKAVGKIPINQVFLPICINWAPCLPNPQAEYCFGRREDAFIIGEEKLGLFH